VKRLAIFIALLMALAPSVSASASTRPSSELLTRGDLSAKWTRYYIENRDTESCPESNFTKPTAPASARVIYVDRSSGTLLLEELRDSANPVKFYDTLITRTLKCPKTASQLDGQVTFQQIRSVDITGVSTPHRAFLLHAVVGSATVTGCVVYALKGNVVVAFAELSLMTLNQQQIKSTFVKALAKV
jgi:hypothetical protein